MRRWQMLVATTLLFLISTGCYHVGIVTRSVAPAESHHLWMHGFIYGLVGSELDSDRLCGTRPIAAVDTYMSIPNMIAAWLTAGIYTPMTAVVTCGNSQPRS